jgi:hypothetical protein
MLFLGVGAISPFYTLSLVNAPIVVSVLIKAFLEGRKFLPLHFVGAAVVTVAVVALFYLDTSEPFHLALVVLLSSLPLVFSASTKQALLRSEVFQLGTFNKASSLTTFIFCAAGFPIIAYFV